jgi:hypothetical protein
MYNHQDFILLHLTLPIITQRRIHALNNCGCVPVHKPRIFGLELQDKLEVTLSIVYLLSQHLHLTVLSEKADQTST